MRVGLDATPLLGQRSGVGRYVEGLLTGLRELTEPERVTPVLTTFSLRGATPTGPATQGAEHARRRLPARLLQPLWARTSLPPVEWLSGRVDAFHATNFVLPPTRRAGGVVSVHDLAFERYPETVAPGVLSYRDAVPRSVARAERVICFTEAVAGEIRERYGVAADKVITIPHGVDPAWARASPLSPADLRAAGLPERFLLVVGNLEPRKNLPLLLAAHRRARTADPDAVPPLVLVGAAGWGDRWAGHEPDSQHTVLAGYLDDALLRSVVASAVAVCMPSRYEGFGLPVLEALAAGRPVLASDIDAHREVSGGLATLLKSDDADAVERWAAAIADLARGGDEPTQPARRQAHAAAFTWARSAQMHAQVYRDAAT